MLKTRILQRIVLTHSEPTTAQFYFVQVKFDVRCQFFVAMTNTGRIYVGNIAQNGISQILHLKATPSALCLFSKSGQNHALIGIIDGSLIQLNIDTRKITGTHRGFGEPILDLDIHHWSDTALATYKLSSIIWNISKDDPTPVRRLTYQDDKKLIKAFFNASDDTVVTCFSDGYIVFWNFPNLEYQAQYSTPLNDESVLVTHLAISQNGDDLLMLTSGRKLIFWKTTGNVSSEVIELSTAVSQVVQMKMLILESVRFVIFLNDHGHLQFLNFKENRVAKELLSKSGKYTNFQVPDVSNGGGTKPIAAFLDNGNVEIVNIVLTRDRSDSRNQKGVPKKSAEDSKKLPGPLNGQNVQFADPNAPQILNQKMEQQLSKKSEKSSSIEFIGILQKFGEFPTKYRTLIWKTLLQLPLNESIFTQLFRREMHPAYSNLEDTFPVDDSKLMDVLKKILSCLAYWCPLFAEVTYLPLLVFPFVKALMDAPLICFETIMTYFVNWCQDWFQLYPAPPFSILGEIDLILESMAPQLMAHFKIHQVSARIYAWALLESSFSDIFTKKEWFAIWDHVFTEHQNFNFLYAIVVAYSCVAQNALLRCSSLDDFQRYFHEKNPILVKSVLDKAKDISLNIKRKRILHNRPFLPLPQGVYPQFSNYPLAAVKNHAYQMQKIRKMEKDYLEQRKAVLQLEAEYGSLPELQEKIRQKDAILQAADYLQMQEVMHEDQRLCNQRLRLGKISNSRGYEFELITTKKLASQDALQVLKKEMESKELTILDAKKLQLIQDHQLRQESQIKRMADTAHWMAVMRHDELHEAVDDMESMGFQHQVNMSRLEIDLLEKETETNKRSTSKNNTTHTNLQTGNIKRSNRSQQPVEATSKILRQKADVHHSSKVLEERLEEQLRRVEDNNKNMEAEIKHMIDTLHIGHFI